MPLPRSATRALMLAVLWWWCRGGSVKVTPLNRNACLWSFRRVAVGVESEDKPAPAPCEGASCSNRQDSELVHQPNGFGSRDSELGLPVNND